MNLVSLSTLWELLHATQIYSFPVAFPLSSIVEQTGMCTCVCYGLDREHCVQGEWGGKTKQ